VTLLDKAAGLQSAVWLARRAVAKAMKRAEFLKKVDHRPYPLPAGRYAMRMTWARLLFAHWPVPVEALRPIVPDSLEIDTYDGVAWVGVVPFVMTGVRPRLLPPIPGLSTFLELNVRTYVGAGSTAGGWFWSLDANSRVAVAVARRTFHLPYFTARMTCEVAEGWIGYESARTHRGAGDARLSMRYRPVGEVWQSEPGSLGSFLTERYCLFAVDPAGRLWRGDIHHEPWPLQRAECETAENSMTGPLGVTLPDVRPHLLYADRLDVCAWRLALHKAG